MTDNLDASLPAFLRRPAPPKRDPAPVLADTWGDKVRRARTICDDCNALLLKYKGAPKTAASEDE